MKLIIGENERKSFGKLATLEILEGGGGETMENRNEPQCDNWIVMSFRSDMETDINKEIKRIPNWEPQNRVGPAQRNRKPAITPPPADYNRAEVWVTGNYLQSASIGRRLQMAARPNHLHLNNRVVINAVAPHATISRLTGRQSSGNIMNNNNQSIK